MGFADHGLNLLLLVLLLIVGGYFYFLPTIIGRHKKNSGTIFLCNLFFGCTGVGWIVCLIWALSKD